MQGSRGLGSISPIAYHGGAQNLTGVFKDKQLKRRVIGYSMESWDSLESATRERPVKSSRTLLGVSENLLERSEEG